MIYILAALLPPLGLLLNGQPFSALLNLVLIVPCLIFGLVCRAGGDGSGQTCGVAHRG